MNQSVMVALMAIGMFVSTFLIGFLPTKFKTSQKWMNIIAIYGAGLLVGAAIIIILPEGMLVLFESMISPDILVELGLDAHATQGGDASTTPPTATTTTVTAEARTILADPHNHSTIFDPNVIQYAGLSLIFGFSLMLILDQGFLIIQERAMNKKVKKVRDAADPLEQDRALHSPKGSAGKLHFEAINGGSDQDQ